MNNLFNETIRKQIDQAQFFMLRYETELTPCTGITAVSKQERLHFSRGVMISPWCPLLERKTPEDDPLKNGKVRYAGIKALKAGGKKVKVLVTTDSNVPIIFLEVEDHFLGKKTPYDVSNTALRKDALIFGLAVNEFLLKYGMKQQFIWGADWETVPALFLLKDRHHISLTLHNTFDECLRKEAVEVAAVFKPFTKRRSKGKGYRTALEIGMKIADVVTTVNRGFAYGMRNEPIQKSIMAGHLQAYLDRVVGINNASFTTISPGLKELSGTLASNFKKGCEKLFNLKAESLEKLPEKIVEKAQGKVIIVSMGRCAPQKQHDVLVESVRALLKENSNFPILVILATVPGDAGSNERLKRMKKLQKDFPENVICEEGRISYFSQLMTAADYNCMPSLYEPHGGAFDGIIVPIARAIDGLAEQICAIKPTKEVAQINSLWHTKREAATGFLFREQIVDKSSLISDLAALLKESPSPNNSLFKQMQKSLIGVLKQAVKFRTEEPNEYARLVLNILDKQQETSWLINLGGMQSLIEKARIKRSIS